MRIVSLVGARPNFVKIASLLRAMRAFSHIESILVHTGQHYDAAMSEAFFTELDIPSPDINLGVGSSDSEYQIHEIIERLEPVIRSAKPNAIIVVGDVNSTLAGALAAAKLRVPLAHIEAGLRSFDRTMPEEINRVVTDSLSDLLFASEPSGLKNLLREGKPARQVFLAGNVMIDTLRRCLPAARRLHELNDLGLGDPQRNSTQHPSYAVVTLHRPSTVDDPRTLRVICQAIEEIACEIPTVFPVHPRTCAKLQQACLTAHDRPSPTNGQPGIRLIPPLSYLQFLSLQARATLVITDSGGIQEETTVLGVPCLTVRENTERPITVTEGTNTLVGLDPERLIKEARKVIRGEGKRGRVPALWDGHASERIITILSNQFRPRSVMIQSVPIRPSSGQLVPLPSA